MAVTRRGSASGAPTLAGAADPVYDRISDARVQASRTGTAPEISEGSILTGMTANVRSGAGGTFLDSTLTKTAAAISRSQGLGDEGTAAIRDYWDASGRWPDFTGGAGNSAGAVTAPPGGKGSAAGQFADSWIWIAAIAGGLALLVLLSSRKKGR